MMNLVEIKSVVFNLKKLYRVILLYRLCKLVNITFIADIFELLCQLHPPLIMIYKIFGVIQWFKSCISILSRINRRVSA